MPRNIQTYEQQTLPFGGIESIPSPAGSLANRSASPENGRVQPMTAISGRKCLEQFERFAPAGSLARTFPELLIGQMGWYSSRCALIWKLRATKCNRTYFRLAVSAPHIGEIESGLLPTAQTQGLKMCKNRKTVFYPLKLLPTPTAMMPGDVDLAKLDARREKVKAIKKNGNGFGASLNELALKGLLPTPQAVDYKGGSRQRTPETSNGNLDDLIESIAYKNGITSRLNPRFVAEMMGFPPDYTELPFRSGEPKASRDSETQ